MSLVEQHTIVACLRLACEANIVEILREAGPEVSPQGLISLCAIDLFLRAYTSRTPQPRPSYTPVN